MQSDDYIQLWNQVLVRVLDVRLKKIGQGDFLHHYILPTSTFVFVARGQGELWLDNEIWLANRFHLLHGGKGNRLTVKTETSLDVYLMMYKTALPSSALREFHLMLQNDAPFDKSWGISPLDPLELLDLVQAMFRNWHQADDGFNKLQVRGHFIQFIQSVLRQRKHALSHGTSPLLAEQVIRYLSRNYRSAISIESLALTLNYSPQYVSRKFKEQTGRSPMEYVIKLRMDKSQELLLTTDATLREVAAHVGYPDLFYFNRMFKKTFGAAPGHFRNQHVNQPQVVSDSAINQLNPSIVMELIQRYYLNDDENHYHYIRDGEYIMFKGSKSVTTAILWLCLTMMLGACGSAGSSAPGTTHETDAQSANEGSPNNAASNTHAEQEPEPEPDAADPEQEKETKIVSTIFGDIEVPAHAKRVAAISYLGTVLALDVTPVASEEFLMASPYLNGMLDGIEGIGSSLEKLLTLEPDLILTHNTNQDAFDKHSQIAPTVSIPYNAFASLEEEINFFGDLLDKQDEAKQWLETFENQAKDAREKVNAAISPDATFSVMQEYDGLVFMFGSKSGRGGRNIHEVLRLNPPEVVPNEMLQESYYEFSLEMLPEYIGDYLILTTNSTLEELQADPIWGMLPPIKEERVYLWSESQSWFRDPIAMLKQINDLADWIVNVTK
ncbi:helix-turn-helix domain-containing protein [Paenibacillaceae bacterium]|nr:helix-turn-helix domain-containing protein [Paenibacillaceae bacterium]